MDYIAISKNLVIDQAKNLHVDIDLTEFKQLLIKNNIQDKHDEILFAFERFNNSFNSSPINEFQDHNAYVKQNREYWKTLKYILSLKGTIGDSQIKIYKGKGRSNSVIIKDSETVYDLFEIIKEYIAGKLEYYDKETNSVLTPEKFSVELVDTIIHSFRKGDPGRKPTKNKQIAVFTERFVHYLNDETIMKAHNKSKKSSAQLKFIFKALKIFDIQIYSAKNEPYPDNNLRTILKNAKKSVKP
jgi:hypothetical protein